MPQLNCCIKSVQDKATFTDSDEVFLQTFETDVIGLLLSIVCLLQSQYTQLVIPHRVYLSGQNLQSGHRNQWFALSRESMLTEPFLAQSLHVCSFSMA